MQLRDLVPTSGGTSKMYCYLSRNLALDLIKVYLWSSMAMVGSMVQSWL